MFQNIHIFHWLNRRGQPLAMCFEHMNFAEMLFGISSSAYIPNTTQNNCTKYILIFTLKWHLDQQMCHLGANTFKNKIQESKL